MVAFTGSTATGRRIMAAAAPTLKPVFLELGGKSINLVLDDADLAGAMAGAGMVCFHAGQGCAMPTRMMVPRSRYDEAVELAVAAFEGVTYGDPTDASNLMGPVVSEKQRERVLGYIESGRSQGARVAIGGGRPAHLDKGWFVEPTLLVDVDNSMTGGAGGDLRPGARDDPVRGRGRRRAHRQRQPLRAVRHDHRGRPRPRQGRRPPDPHRHPRPQRRRLVRRRRPLRRLQAVGHRSPVRHRGPRDVHADQDGGLAG